MHGGLDGVVIVLYVRCAFCDGRYEKGCQFCWCFEIDGFGGVRSLKSSSPFTDRSWTGPWAEVWVSFGLILCLGDEWADGFVVFRCRVYSVQNFHFFLQSSAACLHIFLSIVVYTNFSAYYKGWNNSMGVHMGGWNGLFLCVVIDGVNCVLIIGEEVGRNVGYVRGWKLSGRSWLWKRIFCCTELRFTRIEVQEVGCRFEASNDYWLTCIAVMPLHSFT